MSNKDEYALHMAYAEELNKIVDCVNAANKAIEVLIELSHKKDQSAAFNNDVIDTLNNRLAATEIALGKANAEAKQKDDHVDLLQRAVDRWADATNKANRELDIEKATSLELAIEGCHETDGKFAYEIVEFIRARVMARPEFSQ